MILDLFMDWWLPDAPGAWWHQTRRLLSFWGPVVILPGLAAPMSLLGSLLGLAILSGIAIASLASFLVAALALYLLLTEIFGIRIELALV